MPNATYAAKPILEIDGKQFSEKDKLMEDILQISVEESLHLPGMFTLVINNPYLSGREDTEPAWQHQKLFEIGNTVKIGFSGGTTEQFTEENKDTILEGEITAMEAHFTSGSQAPIIIRGYDVSHRLHRGRYNRSFQDMTDTDIVNKIAGEVGLSTGTIDSSGAPHDYVFQENQTNMEFLRERAARNGFELFVQDNKLNFRKPKVDNSLQLKWLKDIHSFRVRVNSAEQIKEVEVRGWDYSKKKPIVATANGEKVFTKTQHGTGKEKASDFNGKPPKPKMIVVDQPMFTPKEADTIAQALFDELGGEFVYADARAEGNPKIRPGRVIKLEGMGKYSGEYYVTETRHLFHERVYTTEFSVRGLRGGDLFSILSPQTRLQAGQTLMVGIVSNNKDPEGWGRVRVKFPTLTEEHESNWARVIGIGAGKERGFDCLPEINDEVLVAFEHGDMHRPYVIGGVWNGEDKPPEKVDDTVVDGKVRLRTFKTRTGHTFQFVEEDKGSSKKGVYLDTVYGHHLYLNDSEKFTEAKTKEGHQVRLDDQNKKILIKTKGGHTIELDDQGRKITMSSTGTIEITAPQKMTLKVGSSKIEMNPAGITIDSTKVEVKGKANVNIDGGASTIIKGGVVKIN
ncbi:MAG: VgrG-related protein [Moorea sp. SIO2B7]|nr:VgrG-related protein [Moorena sp. SIO2B7]